MRIGDVYALKGMVAQGATVDFIISDARFRHYTEDEIRRRFASLEPKKQTTLDIDLDIPVERPRARRKVVGDG